MISFKLSIYRLVTSYIWYQKLVEGDVITPRYFSDGVFRKILPITASGKITKTWLVYIDTNLNHSIISCQSKQRKVKQFEEFWKCLFGCSPSCKEINKIISNGCPSKHQFTVADQLSFDTRIHISKTEEQKRPALKYLMGGIQTLAEKCGEFVSFWWNMELFIEKVVVIHYKFEMDKLLKLNVTFVKLDLIRTETIFLINGYECRLHCMPTGDGSCHCNSRNFKQHNCFKLSGRRPSTNVISQGSTLLVKMFISPYVSKVEGLYQVTDGVTVTKQSYRQDVEKLLELYFIWHRKVFVYTMRVVVRVWQVLLLRMFYLKQDFQAHDGPGIHSQTLDLIHVYLPISTFQAFLVYLTQHKDINLMYQRCERNGFDEFIIRKPHSYLQINPTDLRFSYFATNIEPTEVKIKKRHSTSLPPCKTVPRHRFSLLSTQKKSKNLHCVYKIIPSSGFVNISINKMTFKGASVTVKHYSEFSEHYLECFYGGVAFQVKAYGDGDFERKHLCDNYSATPSKEETYDKSMMNIIGHSRDGHLFAVYSYKHYSEVSIDVTLSTTTCRGVHYYQEVAEVESYEASYFDTYKVPPQACIVLQIVYLKQFGTIYSRFKYRASHRVFRKDEVFMYPNPETMMYAITQHPGLLKQMKKMHDEPRLLYYHGKPLNIGGKNIQEYCLFSKCYLEKIKEGRTEKWHWRVLYPIIMHPIYFTTTVVEQPAEANFTSFYFGNGAVGGPLIKYHAWISSTIYHIDCSTPVEEINIWSNLSVDKINYICTEGRDEFLISITDAFNILRPPVSEYLNTFPWKPLMWILLFSVNKKIPTSNSYGSVILMSHQTHRLCDHSYINTLFLPKKLFHYLNKIMGEAWECPVLRTEAQLLPTLVNKKDEIEMAFHWFEDPNIKFYPSKILSTQENIIASFVWKPYKFEANVDWDHDMDLYVVHSKSTKFSWVMAAARCKKRGMVLPSLMSEKITKDIAKHLLQEHVLPTYLLYVALIRKGNVTKWLQHNPLVYYPWEPEVVDSSMSHDLIIDHPQTKEPWFLQIISTSIWLEHTYKNKDYITKHKGVKYHTMYVKTEKLVNDSKMMSDSSSLFGCYALSLFNPIKPHLKLISCYKKILRSFYCQKPSLSLLKFENIHNNNLTKARPNLLKCLNKVYISTLFICDGHKDCLDGSDEQHCGCYINGDLSHDSKYCSKYCYHYKSCTCLHLYTNTKSKGCISYVDKQQIKQPTPVKEIKTENLFLCRNSSGQINRHLVNDLIMDCPGGEDEPELLQGSPANNITCLHPDMIPCHYGHSKCYTVNNECIYNLTTDLQTLMYCRNGQHLQNCEKFNCKSMKKCPHSYCIPYRYLCDGKWDCFRGEDEINCENKHCDVMFKCRSSNVCIHVNNVCDDVVDCPYFDDEHLCNLKDCTDGCTCLNHGIKCNILLVPEIFFFALKSFIFVDLSETKVKGDYANKFHELHNVAIFISKHNNLTSVFTCLRDTMVLKLQLVDYSFNKIQDIYSDHFSCHYNLIELYLSHNKMNRIASYAFQSLTNLQALDVSQNKITVLESFAFDGLHSLKVLNLLGNSFLVIDGRTFNNLQRIKMITDDFHICCLLKRSSSICSTKPSWPFSCNALLSSGGLKLIAWLIGSCICLFNTKSISYYAFKWHAEGKTNQYSQYVMLINVCDLITGVYLLTITVKDVLSGDDYIRQDLLWRGSTICHIIAFFSLLSILLSAFFILMVSFSRYKMMTDSLDRVLEKKGNMKSTGLMILTVGILLFIIIFIRHQIEGVTYLSSPLCFLLADKNNSFITMITTASTSVYLLMILFCIIKIYMALVMKSDTTNVILSNERLKMRQKSINTHVISAGITNALCWIPSSVFFLISVFLNKFPVMFLNVMTLIILPINAMANPILFNLSQIKMTWRKAKQKYF